MKLPKYFVETMQQAIDLHLNAFALQLMAESFGDDPQKFGDENVVFLAHAHGGHEVWFLMTKTMPTKRDFDPAPGPAAPDQTTVAVEQVRDQLPAAVSLLGKRVAFHHAPEAQSMLVESVTWEGMVTIAGMAGEFAPHLFVVKE